MTMYSIEGLPEGFSLKTNSLSMAIDNVQAYILTDAYFDNLDSTSLGHAALEWIIEE